MLSTALTIGERFKDARVVYNKNGKQTLKQVEDETGVSQSLISNLEKGLDRRIGYQDILALARHYGISVDWLLGLSEVKELYGTLSQVCEYTGLSSKTASRLYDIAHQQNYSIEERELLDHFIDYFSRQEFFDIVACYKKAVAASKLEEHLYEKINHAFSLLPQFRGKPHAAAEEAECSLQEFILPKLLDDNFITSLPLDIEPILAMVQFNSSRYMLYQKNIPFFPMVMHNVDAIAIAQAALNNYLTYWQNNLLCGSANLSARNISNIPEINCLIEQVIADFKKEEGEPNG